MESYMKDPIGVFRSWLSEHEGGDDAVRAVWFDYGRVAMAMVAITWIKSLEQLPVTTEVGRQEAITALRTMLVEQGLWDQALETYELLAAWRRPKFLADGPSP